MNAKITQGIMAILLIFLCLNIAEGAEKKGGKTMQKDNAQNPAVKRYDVETAQIEFEMKGDVFPGPGRETRLITDWGMHILSIDKRDAEATKSIAIVDANFNYAFRQNGKDGFKIKVDKKVDKPEWRSNSGLDYSAWMAKNLEAQGFKSSGTRVIAGKTCDVWKNVTNGQTRCFWKGLLFYFESFTPDKKHKYIIEAVKVDEHPTIAKDAFTVPANIKFEEE
jgi:hypothetical protein